MQLKKNKRTGEVPIVTARQAVSLISNGDCVYFGGSAGVAIPELVIDALRDVHSEKGSPENLMLVGTVAIGDWATTGFNKLAAPGLVRRVVASGLNNCPALGRRALANEIEAYTLPQGVLAQLTRENAAGRPGVVTKVGLRTFADPRIGGCKQSECSKEDMVAVVDIEGEEHLLYKTFPIQVAILRGSIADEKGNISLEDEAYVGESMSIAAATRRSGGIVIVQVKRVAASNTLNQREVRIPGVLVDYLVVDPDQRQTYATEYSPAYAGKMRVPDGKIASLPFDVRKVIARRAALELTPGATVNIGYGISNGIAVVAAEEGIYRSVTLTAEQGVIGGIPAPGQDAGAGTNYDMIAPQPDQFDFYDGGGLDIAFLSSAEVDRHGNVNVSRFGDKIIGPGGFINISQGARKVVFSGTLTASGLNAIPDNGTLVIANEGTVKKWVKDVYQITFSGAFAKERQQEVVFITERAVFKLTPNGVMLTEVAPGISVEKHVLANIGFDVLVSPDLKLMDARIFKNEPMNLAVQFHDNAGRA
ncbi:propionate CoA-transferase [Bradyrhizobium elkanii]|uniref:acyl CoA:acetate/3-ketoacid CoA transferase n=1 Tax=Bradyrhizobium TaxID=374 RepID=UPI00216A57F7|nr:MULTISPECIES: CoA-transferase [Bradyrhizobium]MCS3926175.1 propionate CoA-transferase [Bradyrhizobium elkanii]MCS3966727.1 propionate CoA-transferase [Bradyrhizobium japonicum]